MSFKTVKLLAAVVCFAALSVAAFCEPLLPSQFTGAVVEVKPGTYPSRIVVKYFEAVDKGTSVEIGKPKSGIYEVGYNDRHQAVRFREYDLQGNLKEQYDHAYNEQGLLKGEQKKDGSRKLVVYNEYIYKNPGQEKTLNTLKIYNPDKKLLFTDTYHRDKAGNVTALNRVNENGQLQFGYEYAYDKSNNVERKTRTNAKGEKLFEEEYQYDDNNVKLAEIRYDGKGKLVSHIDYEYNNAGLITTITQTSPDGPVQIFKVEYEYDSRGNWIKQTIYKGGVVPFTVIVRNIEYM